MIVLVIDYHKVHSQQTVKNHDQLPHKNDTVGNEENEAMQLARNLFRFLFWGGSFFPKS